MRVCHAVHMVVCVLLWTAFKVQGVCVCACKLYVHALCVQIQKCPMGLLRGVASPSVMVGPVSSVVQLLTCMPSVSMVNKIIHIILF